jgi:hypothetical protein
MTERIKSSEESSGTRLMGRDLLCDQGGFGNGDDGRQGLPDLMEIGELHLDKPQLHCRRKALRGLRPIAVELVKRVHGFGEERDREARRSWRA